MGDSEPVPDRDRHVIAAAYHIVKALEATTSLSGDVRRLLSDLDVHLSKMTVFNDGEVENTREIENSLISAYQTITNLHSNHSRIWDSNPLTVSQYLQSVDEVRQLAQRLEDKPLPPSRKSKELLDRAQSLLHMAMSRLQEELIHILSQNKLCFELDYLVIPTYATASLIIYEESVVSNEDDSVESASQRDSSCIETVPYMVDLVHPDTIPEIKSIADIMLASRYGQEFYQAFTGFWRGALFEYLMSLDFEQLSINDVVLMEWKCINFRIRNWQHAMKTIVRVYLMSAKRLFNQVLGEHNHISSTCLFEASKPTMLCLLNFGHAVAIGPHKPEWLYCLLNMYELLEGLIPDMDSLFPEEIGSLVKVEYNELLTRIGKSVRLIVSGFGNLIASSGLTTPYPNGGIHHLTRYIVNYILCFPEYEKTINFLLQSQDTDREQNVAINQSNNDSPVAAHLKSWMSILEANLDIKSDLYRDESLKHIFMMNNIHYMVRKIQNSKIGTYFGDEWIKKHIGKFQHHAMCYQRSTWNPILPLLREDGKKCKVVLKGRCKSFASAFEDVYKNQTKWCIPDIQLREDIRISAAKAIIPAYRNFFSKMANSIGEKYLKYTEQDLEIYILDLFEGAPKSLNHSNRR